EKLITKKDAVLRIPADSLAHLLAPIFDRASAKAAKKIGSGLAAGPGAASGHVVFSAEEAVRRAEKGDKVVLARIETDRKSTRLNSSHDQISYAVFCLKKKKKKKQM